MAQRKKTLNLNISQITVFHHLHNCALIIIIVTDGKSLLAAPNILIIYFKTGATFHHFHVFHLIKLFSSPVCKERGFERIKVW